MRNAGTIGANIANGSPIGDTPPPLIALGARSPCARASAGATVKLEDFFIAYGKQDRQPGEFVESVTIPLPAADEQVAVYKISKRRDEDISSVLRCVPAVRCRDGKVAAGHASPSAAWRRRRSGPRRWKLRCSASRGRRPRSKRRCRPMPQDYQPLTDMRASAEYRLLVAQNLLRRFFLETIGAGERLAREVA